MIPKIWISDENPPRVLFVKGRSGIDPDCLVAIPEGETDSVWIVFDGDYEFKKANYFVCSKGREFRARPACIPQESEVSHD